MVLSSEGAAAPVNGTTPCSPDVALAAPVMPGCSPVPVAVVAVSSPPSPVTTARGETKIEVEAVASDGSLVEEGIAPESVDDVSRLGGIAKPRRVAQVDKSSPCGKIR